MSVLVPITVEGKLVDRPELGQTEHGRTFCRFTLEVQDRRYDEAAGQWEDDGDAVRHRATVFGKQAEHVAASLRKGDRAIVAGQLQFLEWESETGAKHNGTQIVASQVGPSLRFNRATPDRTRRHGAGPSVTATGPVTATATPATAGLDR
jgi:single-strand DNA-binding protein